MNLPQPSWKTMTSRQQLSTATNLARIKKSAPSLLERRKQSSKIANNKYEPVGSSKANKENFEAVKNLKDKQKKGGKDRKALKNIDNCIHNDSSGRETNTKEKNQSTKIIFKNKREYPQFKVGLKSKSTNTWKNENKGVNTLGTSTNNFKNKIEPASDFISRNSIQMQPFGNDTTLYESQKETDSGVKSFSKCQSFSIVGSHCKNSKSVPSKLLNQSLVTNESDCPPMVSIVVSDSNVSILNVNELENQQHVQAHSSSEISHGKFDDLTVESSFKAQYTLDSEDYSVLNGVSLLADLELEPNDRNNSTANSLLNASNASMPPTSQRLESNISPISKSVTVNQASLSGQNTCIHNSVCNASDVKNIRACLERDECIKLESIESFVYMAEENSIGVKVKKLDDVLAYLLKELQATKTQSEITMRRNETLLTEVRFAGQTCVELSEKNKALKINNRRLTKELREIREETKINNFMRETKYENPLLDQIEKDNFAKSLKKKNQHLERECKDLRDINSNQQKRLDKSKSNEKMVSTKLIDLKKQNKNQEEREKYLIQKIDSYRNNIRLLEIELYEFQANMSDFPSSFSEINISEIIQDDQSLCQSCRCRDNIERVENQMQGKILEVERTSSKRLKSLADITTKSNSKNEELLCQIDFLDGKSNENKSMKSLTKLKASLSSECSGSCCENELTQKIVPHTGLCVSKCDKIMQKSDGISFGLSQKNLISPINSKHLSKPQNSSKPIPDIEKEVISLRIDIINIRSKLDQREKDLKASYLFGQTKEKELTKMKNKIHRDEKVSREYITALELKLASSQFSLEEMKTELKNTENELTVSKSNIASIQALFEKSGKEKESLALKLDKGQQQVILEKSKLQTLSKNNYILAEKVRKCQEMVENKENLKKAEHESFELEIETTKDALKEARVKYNISVTEYEAKFKDMRNKFEDQSSYYIFKIQDLDELLEKSNATIVCLEEKFIVEQKLQKGLAEELSLTKKENSFIANERQVVKNQLLQSSLQADSRKVKSQQMEREIKVLSMKLHGVQYGKTHIGTQTDLKDESIGEETLRMVKCELQKDENDANNLRKKLKSSQMQLKKMHKYLQFIRLENNIT